MAKVKDYGYKTPVRRSTNNITGHKVGGSLSGGDCKIKPFYKIKIESSLIIDHVLNIDEAELLFNTGSIVIAIGGYFTSDKEVTATLSFIINGSKHEKSFPIQPGLIEKIGFDIELTIDGLDTSTPINLKLQFETKGTTDLEYIGLNYGFINYRYFKENDVHNHFNNSKKQICIPEQYYFFDEKVINGSTEGSPLILKSCNRCQRFLPINPFYDRLQIAFSNHCAAKAPCRHGNFSNYKVLESYLDTKELEKFIESTSYTIKDDFIISHFGHQLECKACKKFFVNASLNHLRTSTQHREDSLRRRAFELLVRDLLGMEWIYHTFRVKTSKEFDKHIWEKFGKKCFKCDTPLPTAGEMDLDHTMPLVNLYPLDETATCLCPTCNGEKSGLFPVDFYTKEQLLMLSKLTGLDKEILFSREPNQKAIDALRNKIVWFFDTFLTFEEYTKEREGKKAADSILHSLQKIVNNSKTPFDLIKEYEKKSNA